MSWISNILSKGSKLNGQLVMKYSKEDDAWLVMRGNSILFVGDEKQCNAYMWNHLPK